MVTEQNKLETLEKFADAWNRHDIEALMSFMAEDCFYLASVGPEKCGKEYRGFASVREGFSIVYANFPDAHWGEAKHFVCGSRGVSEWIFTGTKKDGKKIEVDGCDLFTFDENGKILIKNSYRKGPVI